MSAPDFWLAIILMTVATVVTRSSFFVLGSSVKLPPKVRHALRYAPAAALAAIVIPDLVLGPAGTLEMGWDNPKLLAGVGAGVFFFATRHMLWTLGFGMVLFTVLRITL